jgi:hypothetical protein
VQRRTTCTGIFTAYPTTRRREMIAKGPERRRIPGEIMEEVTADK